MKRISYAFYCLFLALVFVGASIAQDMNPDAGKLYNDGNKMLKAGNYKGAIDNYNKALGIEKDYRIYYQKGVALKKSGEMAEAKSSFEEVLKAKPDFEAGYNALGGVYFSMGDYQKAIDNFEKVVETAKSDKVKNAVKKNLSLAYAKLGNVELQNGSSAKGIDALEKAVQNDNYDAAYLSLAKAYSDLGEYDKCLAAAQNALKYKSSISKGGPYYYMGVAYKNKGDNEKAKEMFKQAKGDATYKKLVDYELSALK